MKHEPLRPAVGPVDLIRPREAAASPDHAARAFEAALSRADARCEAGPEPQDRACAPPRPAATPKPLHKSERELAREPQSLAPPPASTAPRQEASRAFGDAPARRNGARAQAEPPPRRQHERSCAPAPRPACAPPSHGASPGPDQARSNPARCAAPEPRSACQETVARAPAPNARPVASAPSCGSGTASATSTPCGSASSPSNTAESTHTVSRPDAKGAEPLEAGRARPSEPEAPETPVDQDQDDTAELALLTPPGPVPELAPPVAAASANGSGAAAPAFAGMRHPSMDPTAGVTAAAGGARRARPLLAALAAPAQAGPARAPAQAADQSAPPAPSANAPASAFDARPVPVFEAPPTAGQTSGAETAQQHAHALQGLAAADPSQARVWQVELPMGPHADAMQLTVSRHFEANATARADAVWALSLPAHRHARAALDALKVRLQRRGLSVGQVEGDVGAEPPDPLPR